MTVRRLHISPDLSLPQDTVTSTLIVYGGKGMGKTNFGSVLVEELTKSGLRWSVLDPLGVWWGLRHSSDGKGSGIECLVLGGSHADIPIEPTGGAIVADLVVDETANVVIDFSRKPSGEMWSIGERIRFVTEYTLRLFQRQGELVKGLRREPLFQILDEAARYIPQIIPSGAVDLAKCVGAWEQLVEEGRNIGVGVGLLTQRSARMNKSVSEVADAILSFRIVGPNSIGAITDWLGEHVPKDQIKIMVETIRSLERGRCLVVSPGWLKFEGVVGIRQRDTFDSSATPKPGEHARRVHGEGAKPDLEKYIERMKATIEKAKQDDPRELKRQISELHKQLAKVQKVTPKETREKVITKTVERRIEVVPREVKKEWNRLQEKLRLVNGHVDLLSQAMGRIPEPSPHASLEVAGIPVRLDPSMPKSQIDIEDARGRRPFMVNVGAPTSNGHSNLPPGERAVLIAAAQFGSVNKDQLSVLTGYKRSSRDAYIARLLNRGYIEVQGRMVAPTTDGVSALGSDYEPLPTGSDLYQYWMAKLPEGESKILELLVRNGGQPMERSAIDDATGYKRSSRDAYISRMMAKRLVETPERNVVRASRELFDN